MLFSRLKSYSERDNAYKEDKRMKNYIAPQMDIVLLDIEDVITVSNGDIEVGAGNIFG